ncbi:MAG: preprotein translocase subunit SecY [Prevotella sp.]|nr:preprotein translocase subunit SecY [Staphylococcus sp.]MCM1350747.1 preprotein translocase subunit SecY [Prevotella sp.]
MKKFFGKYKKLIGMILFTALCLLVWRVGIHIKFPFANYSTLPTSGNANIFGFLDVFAGGGLSQFSILSLGISPYITSSIVVEMLQLDIIPAFKEWAEEGEEGKEKLNRWTRYIALFIAFVQALALILGLKATSNVYFRDVSEFNAFTYIYIAIVLTAGTAFTLWLADQITMRGIGNGSSMLIVAGIVVSLPTMMYQLFQYFLGSESTYRTDGVLGWQGVVLYIVMMLIFLGIVVAVVWMEGLQRKIPVVYANRPAGSKLIGQQDSNIPIKLNSASVIPVIFASTLLSLPTTVLEFIAASGKTVSEWWYTIFSYQKPIGFAIYIILIFVFAFFYSFLQIDPDKMADNLKKQNAHIPGIKPGEDTATFISKVLFKVTLLGATYLAILASIPVIVTFIFPSLPSSVQIGGTSLMIVVGVAIETVKQIKTEGQSQDYHGFM